MIAREGGMGAGLRRQLMTILHRQGVHRLARNIVGQVSSEFAAKFRLRAFRIALVRLLDDPLVDARIHLQRAGLPDEDTPIVATEITAVSVVKLAALRIGTRRHQQHRARYRHHARPQRAQNFDIRIETRLVRTPERQLVAQDRGIRVTARRAKARNPNLDHHPIAQLDRLDITPDNQLLQHRHSLQQPKNKPENRPRLPLHLTPGEVERLIKRAKDNRQGHRDATMILIAFRHGLRASELVDLRWEQTDLGQAVLHVRRVKNGTPATHPLTGRELRALRRLQREGGENPFVFVSERGAPFSVSGFRRMIERAGQAARLQIKAHPHMLRHATGYALANRGTDTRTLQAYLGHRNISNTVRYTELASGRFKNLWND